MALTQIEGILTADDRSEVVDFLVDSGAFYTSLPEEVWKRLRLEPTRTARLRLADGTVIRRDLSECKIEIEGERATSPVILGRPNDLPILGALTLETLGLVLNPLTRTLHPARIIMPMIAVRPGGIEDET